MTIYSSCKQAYRKMLPRPLRSALARSKWKQLLNSCATYDGVYDKEYFINAVAPTATKSAPVMASSIFRELKPSRVVDVGCGTGVLLEEFMKSGCTVLGLDNAEAALEMCRERDIAARKLDLENSEAFRLCMERFDIAVSFEVAEHLPEKCALGYVKLLTSLANTIVITAARPGQGGTDHVNEQEPDYWIQKFAALHFVPYPEIRQHLKEDWQSSGEVAEWYWKNLLVFTSKTVE